ncbi:hypothetical protein [Spongiactinospora rosea]|uniref:hypothetical protein n=1 Tax=Spongiactinospora rosea TaxID=2248750 RepID=UPI0013149567|nr:hypothetical protein [Spongiactinospora rosea]
MSSCGPIVRPGGAGSAASSSRPAIPHRPRPRIPQARARLAAALRAAADTHPC